MTIFRELREGQTLNGKLKLKSPSGSLSTAEAIAVTIGAWAEAGHFGSRRHRRIEPCRQPRRRHRERPGAGQDRAAGISRSGGARAEGLGRSLFRHPRGDLRWQTAAAYLRHPASRPRFRAQPGAGARRARSGRGADRRPARGQRADCLCRLARDAPAPGSAHLRRGRSLLFELLPVHGIFARVASDALGHRPGAARALHRLARQPFACRAEGRARGAQRKG